MSARAAERLEALGFGHVFRYTAGKVDWLAAGLPSEGRLASQPRAGDGAPRDASICHLGEPVGDVARKARTTGSSVCVVLHGERVVLGLLDAAALGGDPSAAAEDVMRPAPTLVTDPDGRLIGLLLRRDVDRRLADVRAHAISNSLHHTVSS